MRKDTIEGVGEWGWRMFEMGTAKDGEDNVPGRASGGAMCAQGRKKLQGTGELYPMSTG